MPAQPGADLGLEDVEMRLLLEGIALHYGYDFREYAQRPLRRNIVMSMAIEGVPTISQYQDRILHDPESFERFLDAAGVNVSSLFREADALLYFREEIVPWLRTFPSAQVWMAGCGTGEDVVSLAIVLHETGLLHRTRIYATDINARSLAIARAGRYPLDNARACEGEYTRSGGLGRLADYYSVHGDLVSFDRSLLAGVTWGRHNLTSDASLNEFHAIQCTNVLTYFSVQLQERVHALIYDSLVQSGFLILGRLESMIRWPGRDSYGRVDQRAGVYRKLHR